MTTKIGYVVHYAFEPHYHVYNYGIYDTKELAQNILNQLSERNSLATDEEKKWENKIKEWLKSNPSMDTFSADYRAKAIEECGECPITDFNCRSLIISETSSEWNGQFTTQENFGKRNPQYNN